MLLFVDTEYADLHARELVSLALVSEDGRFEFYAERDPLPSSPTDFVRDVVYPLLDRGEQALPDERFTRELCLFFQKVRSASHRGQVRVAYDFEADIYLLDLVVDGFTPSHWSLPPLFDVFNLGRLDVDYDEAVGRVFAANPDLAARRHHALVDARVNRDAYLNIKSSMRARLR